MLNKHRRIKNWDNEIEPDEIFLDSENIPAFNRQQFEGRLEKPITKRTIFFLAAVFLIIIFAYLSLFSFLFSVLYEYKLKKIERRDLFNPFFHSFSTSSILYYSAILLRYSCSYLSSIISHHCHNKTLLGSRILCLYLGIAPGSDTLRDNLSSRRILDANIVLCIC